MVSFLLLLLLLFIQEKKRHKPVSPAQYKKEIRTEKNHNTASYYITFTDDNCQIVS